LLSLYTERAAFYGFQAWAGDKEASKQKIHNESNKLQESFEHINNKSTADTEEKNTKREEKPN